MPKSQLRQKIEEVLALIETQKGLFLKKIDGVDHEKAVENASEYEAFMPALEEFQGDLDFMNKESYQAIEEVGDAVIDLYDKIEGVSPSDDEELEGLSPEEDVELTEEQEGRIYDVDDSEPIGEIESELSFPEK